MLMDEGLEQRISQLEAQLRSRRKKWIVLGMIVLLVTSIAVIITYPRPQPTATTEVKQSGLEQLAAQAGFTVFVPGELPQGFSLDEASASLSSGVLLYTIRGPNGSHVIVTQQQKPSNFDYQAIVTDSSFKTPYGTATAYEQSDKSMGSLVSDTTWVVCNSSKSIGAKAMEAVLQSFQTTNRH